MGFLRGIGAVELGCEFWCDDGCVSFSFRIVEGDFLPFFIFLACVILEGLFCNDIVTRVAVFFENACEGIEDGFICGKMDDMGIVCNAFL